MTRLSTPEPLCGHHPQGPITMGLPIALTNQDGAQPHVGHATGLSTPLSDVLSDVLSAKFAVARTLTQ